MLWRFDGQGVLAHLGMTGKFELQEPGEPAVRWSHAQFERSDGAMVHYRDPRQFGRLTVAPLAKLLSTEPLASLGPDAWESKPTSKVLQERLSARKRPIKDVLFDQTVLAQLGNIQVTEALWNARIHPLRPAAELTRDELRPWPKAFGRRFVGRWR